MMNQNEADPRPKLSLLAQYDDIVRCSSQLYVGLEDEFIAFLENQTECLRRWGNVVKDTESLKYEVLRANKDKDLADTQLKHMRSLLEKEIEKRAKVEGEKKSLERQIALIKEVLLADQSALNDQAKEKLAFLNTNAYDVNHRLDTIEESMGSILSASDFSYDKTDEDLFDNEHEDGGTEPKRKRANRQIYPCGKDEEQNIFPKKQKLHPGNFEGHVNLGPRDNGCDEVRIQIGTGARRSTRSKRVFSEPAPEQLQDRSPQRQICRSDNDPFADLFEDDERDERRLSTQITPLRRLSSAMKMNRQHIFCTKTLIRAEMCLFCNRRIGFYKQAMKCQECKTTCHPECKDSVPVPCFPSVRTPTSKAGMGVIADYTPNTSPMIPAIIIHCVNEIELRGFSEIGLYRISGSEREVRELKDKFLKAKSVPLLNKADIHAICGTVKDFLRSLKEPLITKALWKDFVRASEMSNVQEGLSIVYQLVDRLPQPNRDTLSFMLLHLNNVADSPDCKMPAENLAKIFGPTLIGNSVAEPTASTMISETKCQCEVMMLLLKVPLEFWNKFVASDSAVFTPSTPEPRQGLEGNLLGPLYSGGSLPSRSRAVTLAKIPLTPRNVSGTVRAKRQFFMSPLLK